MPEKYNAPVICLRETNLEGGQMTLKGYIAYHKTGTIDDLLHIGDQLPIYPATGSLTFVNLTMCSLLLFMDFTWRAE